MSVLFKQQLQSLKHIDKFVKMVQEIIKHRISAAFISEDTVI